MIPARITIVWIGAILALGPPGISHAFHSGGVAECIGCHSMHSTEQRGPSPSLLVQSDPSSVCLTCHQGTGDTGPNSYHISTAESEMPPGAPPKQRTPGGDFAWLKKDYTFVVDGQAVNEDGDRHGHNIVAADFGYRFDRSNHSAPGGTFPAARLACTSCHDPHGNYRRLADGRVATTGASILASGSYATNDDPRASDPPAPGTALGSYRLLAGNGYSNHGATFPGVPAAKAPSVYNRSEEFTQTRVAYGNATTGGHATWDDWCGTCHSAVHSGGSLEHPVDEELGSEIGMHYDQYVKTGDMTGTGASSFTSLVPFIEYTGDYLLLASHAKNDDTYLAGPAPSDRVSCLTCHRAHASGWPYALRWSHGGEFITYGGQYPGIDTTPAVPEIARGRTSAETRGAYYDRPVTAFAPDQRVLCEKCHAAE
ncbi:MAG: cytochrome C [Deltaproteobacteria bacterium]|nr:MAG: cytochrome C [Deltaproteobacteria bacterium]